MTKNTKVSGMVVLYNPSDKVLDNIKLYINEVEKLYIVDNSEIVNRNVKVQLKNNNNTEYIELGENKGIAKALNIGAHRAIQDGYKWILTMDQDSKPKDNMIDKMVDYIKNNDTNDVGIISPYHLLDTTGFKNLDKDIHEPIRVMTSGNFLNLNIYKQLGGFMNELFIDSVDHEYCYKLKKNNYRIIRINEAILNHNLGEDNRLINFLGKTLRIINHNYIRIYYMTRNELYVRKLYKKNIPRLYRNRYFYIMILIIRIIGWENNKLKKIKYLIKGYIDSKHNKLGKIN